MSTLWSKSPRSAPASATALLLLLLRCAATGRSWRSCAFALLRALAIQFPHVDTLVEVAQIGPCLRDRPAVVAAALCRDRPQLEELCVRPLEGARDSVPTCRHSGRSRPDRPLPPRPPCCCCCCVVPRPAAVGGVVRSPS